MSQPPSRLLPPPALPEELIIEILIRLSVKSLLRFRCICKSWKSLISSPQFVKDHLHNSISDTSTNHQQLVILSDYNPNNRMTTCSIQSLFKNPSTLTQTPSFTVDPKYRLIVGSCNGLVCLSDLYHSGYFRLWNFSTRLASKTSPRARSYPLYYGFGYNQVKDEYKVLLNYGNPIKITKIHTFGTNSWTTIQNPPRALDGRNVFGKFVSGTLNWLATECDVIISFDMEKETYGQVLIPPQLDGGHLCYPVLGVLSNGLCLCYFHGSRYVVWLMKKYGIQEPWIKLMSIPICKLHISFDFLPLYISENGVVLAKYDDSGLVMYNSNSETLDYPKIEGRYQRDILIYHESLVSPL